MALFKLRKGGDEPVAQAAQPESVEAMRRRAKHRLIGASLLVLVGVVGFPLLFDTQPRPIPVDIPIEIPDRNKVKPLVPAQVAPATVPAAPVAQSGAVSSGPVTAASTAPAPAAAKEEPKPAMVAKVDPKPEPKPEAKAPEAKPEPKDDDGARAKALLEGKAVDLTEGRFVVQVGAFADAGKARETRLKVEKSGLKTYTHVAETKEGKLIRVRVGPFASRAEADKAAEKIKGLDLQPKILTL